MTFTEPARPLSDAFEGAGVVLIDAEDQLGPGVRLLIRKEHGSGEAGMVVRSASVE